MLLALALRLITIAWGLPSALDPDEPLFLMLGLKLLAGPTLDPGWFGHPGTTTIYVTAAVQAVLIAVARATGEVDSAREWVLGFFRDPTVPFVTARVVFVLFGCGCVAMTWRLARALWDGPTAAAAALLLALNPLHIVWSQIIRTDVQASFFMLMALAAGLDVARGNPAGRSRRRDHARAAAWAGAAIATKWPAAAVLVGIAGAALIAAHPPRGGRIAWAALAVAGSVAALVLISPFLLIDHAAALKSVSGEAQASHLGATGGGLFDNLAWYVSRPIAASFGWVGVAAAAIGLGVAVRRRTTAAIVVAPAVAFVILVSSQGLVWERWIVPALPFVAMLAAAGLTTVTRALAGRRWLAIAAAAAVVGPVAVGAVSQVRERGDDTRLAGERWLAAHAPPGARVLVEYPALALLRTRLEFLYPAGAIGCIDGRRTLAGTVKLPAVDAMRAGRAILDIGTIDPARMAACPADYALFSDYDRYLAEAARYPRELAVYRALLRRGRTVAVFAPRRGRIGGPVVRIVALRTGRAKRLR